MNHKLENIEKLAGCPPGLFQVEASGQCFKYYEETQQTWQDAKTKCEDDGLVLARPHDPLTLSKYIVARFSPPKWSWIGAQGDDSNVRWSRDGEIIKHDHSMWREGQPGNDISARYCLTLQATGQIWKSPNDAFQMMGCTDTRPFVCELLRE